MPSNMNGPPTRGASLAGYVPPGPPIFSTAVGHGDEDFGTTVLPWPDPFPMFVGRAFLSNTEGVVDDIREVRYSRFEFYQEPDVLPDSAQGLARLRMDVYFLVPDPDVPGGTRPNREKSPNPVTFTRYVVVSREHKTFQTRGFNIDSHYSKMESMEIVRIDEVTWCWNCDATLCSCCCDLFCAWSCTCV